MKGRDIVLDCIDKLLHLKNGGSFLGQIFAAFFAQDFSESLDNLLNSIFKKFSISMGKDMIKAGF